LSIFKKILSTRQFQCFIESKNILGENIAFHAVIELSGRSKLKEIQSEVGQEKMKKLMLQRTKTGMNILMKACESEKHENQNETWRFAEKNFSREEIHKLMTEKSDDGCDLLSYSIKNENSETVLEFRNQMSTDDELKATLVNNFEMILFNVSQNPTKEMNEIFRNFKFVVNEFKAQIFLNSTDSNSIGEACEMRSSYEDFWIFTFKYSSLEEIEKLVQNCQVADKFYETILTANFKTNQHILMIAAQNEENPDVFKLLWNETLKIEKLRKLLVAQDDKCWKILHYSVNAFYPDLAFIFDIYKNYTDSETFKQILTETDKYGKNLLFIAKNSALPLWKQLENHLDQNTLINILMQIDSDGKYFIRHRVEIKTASKEFLMKIQMTNSLNLLKLLFFIVEHYDYDFTVKIFMNINKNTKKTKILQDLKQFRNEKNQSILDVAKENETDWDIEQFLADCLNSMKCPEIDTTHRNRYFF
jgi:hypothetical protein